MIFLMYGEIKDIENHGNDSAVNGNGGCVNYGDGNVSNDWANDDTTITVVIITN